MPKLANIQHELYCVARASGKTQTVAYLEAGIARNRDANMIAVRKAASSLERLVPGIRKRIVELRVGLCTASLVIAKDQKAMNTSKAFGELPTAVGIIALDKAALLRELVAFDDEISGADLADLYDEHGQFLPVKKWPAVWRKLLVVGIDVEEKKVRSHDGKDAHGNGAWDPGETQTVKIKFANRAQILLAIKELKGRHTDVGAFDLKGGDVNITFVSSEIDKRLEAGRRRVKVLDEGRTLEAEVVR